MSSWLDNFLPKYTEPWVIDTEKESERYKHDHLELYVHCWFGLKVRPGSLASTILVVKDSTQRKF